MSADIVKILVPAILSFVVGITISPFWISVLNKYKVWKKRGGKMALDGKEAVEFNKLHAHNETKVPRMGGLVIWASVFIVVLFIWTISKLWPTAGTLKMDFLSRSQTWIPLFAMGVGGIVGFFSDLLDICPKQREMKFYWRLLVVAVVSSFLGWWFFDKLGVDAISIPFDGYLYLGILIVPFFVLLNLVLYSSGIIDGIDGLSGGVFMFIFLAYSAIAMAQHQIDLAALSASVAGAIAAFLWFNVSPAKFYMTETGSMALTLSIASIAFMTDKMGGGIGLSVLPVVAALLFVTVASAGAQVLSKKFFGRKIFKVAPVHHHFEAIGWPSHKVTMRYWILAIIFAFVGVLLSLTA